MSMLVWAAAVIVVAAVAGMRSCELMEFERDCCLPPEERAPGLFRYRVQGKLIKGQKLGGVRDGWVVVKEVWDAMRTAAAVTPTRERAAESLDDSPLTHGPISFAPGSTGTLDVVSDLIRSRTARSR